MEAAMGTKDHDISSIRTQLTAARWYLDAAVGAAADVALRNLRRAGQIYSEIAGWLDRSHLTGDQREEIERELSAVRSRLEAAGEFT
jgi:hypothetical protein